MCTAEKRVIPGAEGQFEVGSFMSATLSCDHRVIDGTFWINWHYLLLSGGRDSPKLADGLPFFYFLASAIGAEWMKALKGYIENPTTMLL